MCSSGVRVWVVKEVDENGSWLATAQEHILKDFWAEDDHVSDMEHQDAIKKRLCELDVDGGDRAQEMEKYFMKIRHDEAVMIDEKPDIALAIPNDAAWVDLGVEQVLITTRYQKGNFRIRRPLRLAPRIHHRLLYEEKCMRITDCTDLNVVLDCLKQFCIGRFGTVAAKSPHIDSLPSNFQHWTSSGRLSTCIVTSAQETAWCWKGTVHTKPKYLISSSVKTIGPSPQWTQ